MSEFDVSTEVVTAGLALFVLGFAVGPLLWAPLSELFGRKALFAITFGAFTAFNAGSAGSQDIQTLLITRFFAGSFGSSPLSNAGGLIADMFPASQRGLALCLWAAAPFLGPSLGPIIGGFLAMTRGWRWMEGFLAILSGSIWIGCTLVVPETYAPVILRRRAYKLSAATGRIYQSQQDIKQGNISSSRVFGTALSRPWILLVCEPIVLLLSIYMAILYGTLYMFFAAFPIVFQEYRGWNQGVGALAFLGVMVGMMLAVIVGIFDNRRYLKETDRAGGRAAPEVRLPPTLVAAIIVPLGLFWFAWTNSPSIHWLSSIAAGIPIGLGMVVIFLSVLNYLIDSYTIFAASMLAANTVLRALFGAAFPLFTQSMYENLGIHWASSIPAFLALACTPFPLFFYVYGERIRVRCKFAAQSEEFMRQINGQVQTPETNMQPDSGEGSSPSIKEGQPAACDGDSTPQNAS
jgi:multidrug resistance protein